MTPYAEAILKLADVERDGFIQYGVGGRLFRFDLVGFIKACKAGGIPVGVEELRFILQRLDTGSLEDTSFVPQDVVTFVGSVLDRLAPHTMLDPWAGCGLSALHLQWRFKTERFDAYCTNADECEVFRLLDGAEAVHLECSDPLKALHEVNVGYDAVVGFPPFGMLAKNPYEVEVDGSPTTVTDEYGFLLVLASCLRLNRQGIGVFAVPTSFFFSSGRQGKARNVLERLGIRTTAAIELPAGTFGPRTTISSHIVVLQYSTDPNIFVGRFTPDFQQQAELLGNWRARSVGRFPQTGRIVPAATFRGFAYVDLKERIEEQARRMGLVSYPFRDVVTQVHAPQGATEGRQFEERTNAVYLPQMAATRATTTQDHLPERLKSYLQLIVNRDVVEPEFLAGLLNTPFGQLWRDSLRTGDTIPRISKKVLITSSIYLPPPHARKLQSEVIDCQHALTRLKNEISELESRLWQRPSDVKKSEEALRAINHEDRFEDWSEGVPFPLASILWLCHTQGGSQREQYERKIHFFEALAEFVAIVYLSAFSSQPELWSEVRQALSEVLKKNNLSLEMATFGTWKAVVEMMCSRIRRLLNDDAELCFELFKTRNRHVVEAICSKGLVPILQATNKIRNDWMGHTGAIRDSDASRVNEELQQHIQTVRGIFGLVWEDYELLLPGECKLQGGVFTYNVRRIVGTRTPFRSARVEVAEPMEDGHLHLKSPDETRSLKLLPLVKVMPSPRTEENACYFYNRQQKGGIRFLSYHFESDAEVVEEFADAAEALRQLAPNTIV